MAEEDKDSVPSADQLIDQINKSIEEHAASQQKPPPPPPVAGQVTSTSVAPIVQSTTGAISKLNELIPEDARSYIEPALGVAAGHAARKYFIPKNRQYNDDVQAQSMQEMEQAKTQLQRIPADLAEAQKSHAATAAQLQNDLEMAQERHSNLTGQLNRAQQEHAYANVRDPALELERENMYRPAPTSTTQNVELTPRPVGGPATEKYGLGFGLSPNQALEAESMSMVQKGTIPSNVSGAQLTSEIAPEFKGVKETPLMLERSGLEAIKERKVSEIEAEEELKRIKSQDERRLNEIRDEINQHKSSANAELERIKLEQKEASDALKSAKKAHAEHVKNIPINNKMEKRHADDVLKIAEKQSYKTESEILKKLAKIGTKIAPRLVPVAGAALAPLEFELAKKDKEAGNMLRYYSHLMGGTGAMLQATAWPPAMGAGDIMQIPSAAYSIYDTLKGNEEKPQGASPTQSGALPTQSVIK